MKRQALLGGLGALALACSSTTGSPSPAASASPSAAPAASDWLTYQGGADRRGVGPASPTFGAPKPAWTANVDGALYAQLLVAGNVVVAATENDSVYGFDSKSGRQLWRVHLGEPVAGDSLPCGNISPSGITGTPVIDAATRTVYLVAFLQPFHHELYALALDTGAVRWHRSIDAPGAAPNTHQQRSALTLAGGNLYVPYGGLLGDCGQYKGTVVGLKADGSGDLFSWTIAAPREGGIWAPGGAALDAAGDLYVALGNAQPTGTFNYGNAVVRLDPVLKLKDYWAPRDWDALNRSDTDVGSITPAVLNGGLVFQSGKAGLGYLMHADHLGGVGGEAFSGRVCSGGAFGATAYAPPLLYVPCRGEGITAVKLGPDRFDTAWTGGGGAGNTPILAYGRVWAIGGGQPGALLAYEPATGRQASRTSLNQVAPFASPSAAGGRLYVPAWNQVIAFSAGAFNTG